MGNSFDDSAPGFRATFRVLLRVFKGELWPLFARTYLLYTGREFALLTVTRLLHALAHLIWLQLFTSERKNCDDIKLIGWQNGGCFPGGLFQGMDGGGTTKGPKGRISGGPDDKCGQGNGARLESKPGEAHKTHITHGIQAFWGQQTDINTWARLSVGSVGKPAISGS